MSGGSGITSDLTRRLMATRVSTWQEEVCVGGEGTCPQGFKSRLGTSEVWPVILNIMLATLILASASLTHPPSLPAAAWTHHSPSLWALCAFRPLLRLLGCYLCSFWLFWLGWPASWAVFLSPFPFLRGCSVICWALLPSHPSHPVEMTQTQGCLQFLVTHRDSYLFALCP